MMKKKKKKKKKRKRKRPRNEASKTEKERDQTITMMMMTISHSPPKKFNTKNPADRKCLSRGKAKPKTSTQRYSTPDFSPV